jgi:riboflavin kinase/FMN adenylyltransferase
MVLTTDLSQTHLENPIITIGNFDGVHVGHRMLLGRMQELAKTSGRSSAVVTFFPPTRVLFSGAKFLSSAEEKRRLLSPFNPSVVVLIPFDHTYARTAKTRFVQQLEEFNPHTLIVGEDFRFGRSRIGTLNDLSVITDRLETFRLRSSGGEVVSSSRIRKLLCLGKIEEANRLLGSPYLVIGKVIQGQKRGRTIDFPTANVDIDRKKALPIGVFAVTARVCQKKYRGMANVGPRPSFPDQPPSFEVHLFAFNGKIYGESLEVTFHSYIREQTHFKDLAALKAQLNQDRQIALTALEGLTL